MPLSDTQSGGRLVAVVNDGDPRPGRVLLISGLHVPPIEGRDPHVTGSGMLCSTQTVLPSSV
jgi:hypothetical protein